MAAPDLPVARRWAVGALLMLTAATGMVDAVSYLGVGHVFVANMTGNVVFLGFSLNPRGACVGGAGLSPSASAVAIAGFVVGSLCGGRAGKHLHQRTRLWLGGVFGLEAAVMLAVALLIAVGAWGASRLDTLSITASLAVCFGLQNATVRKLAPADLTTTVLTMAITGLAADSVLGGGTGAKPVRRLTSIAAMLVGAGAGALLLRVTVAGVIACAAALVAFAAGTFRYAPEHSKSAEPADAVPAPNAVDAAPPQKSLAASTSRTMA